MSLSQHRVSLSKTVNIITLLPASDSGNTAAWDNKRITLGPSPVCV